MGRGGSRTGHYGPSAIGEFPSYDCAFKSFEGKNSQVQSMIANHINDDGMIRPGMNFDLLASEYSSFIATMNAGKLSVSALEIGSPCGHNFRGGAELTGL